MDMVRIRMGILILLVQSLFLSSNRALSTMIESRGPIMLIIGTRPEGIKMAPVYYALKRAGMNPLICSTAQHTTLLDDVFEVFSLKPDISLNIMKPGQDLFYITQTIMSALNNVFETIKPSLVLVHGDTTTSVVAAMAAFYKHIPVGHVEAGVRSGTLEAPFPEEANRRITSVLARYHFAPTEQAVRNLRTQGIEDSSIIMTGNTVVDALHMVRAKIDTGTLTISSDLSEVIEQQKAQGKKIILLTAHRREAFDEGLTMLFKTIKEYAQEHPEVVFWFPMHPNPRVKEAVKEAQLAQTSNVTITQPLNYPDLMYLLTNAHVVVTDSGGIQEEAASLGIPAVVVREQTDRPEAVEAGLAELVGYEPAKIRAALTRLLSRSCTGTRSCSLIYGDDHAADRIAEFLSERVVRS